MARAKIVRQEETLKEVLKTGFRISQCEGCDQIDMLDKTDLCLNCACDLKPELALKLKEFQKCDKLE